MRFPRASGDSPSDPVQFFNVDPVPPRERG